MSKPWPVYREHHFCRLWWGKRGKIQRRLNLRRRWPRSRYNRRPLAHPWGHWAMSHVVYGLGGLYSYDYYYLVRRYMPLLHRPAGHRVYSVATEDAYDYDDE